MNRYCSPEHDRRVAMGARVVGRLLAPALVAVAAVAMGALAPAVVAQAQEIGFTVSPLLIELSGLPGATATFEITVAAKDAGRAGRFTVEAVPVQQDLSGNYRIDRQRKDDERSAAGWIQVSPQQFTLEPGKGQVITGELTFPRRFRGGAYAAVLITLLPDERASAEGGGPRQLLRNEVSVIIEAVAYTPGVRPDMRLERFSVLSAAQKGLESFARRFGAQALVFAGDLVNEGTVHGFASGTVSLWDEAGRKLKQIPLGSGRGAILPGATVRMVSVLPGGLPPGHYALQAVVNYGGLRPAILRHKFTVGAELLQSGQGGRGVRLAVEPDAVNFNVLPGSARYAAVRVRNLDRVAVKVQAQVLGLVYDAAGNPNTQPVETGGPAAAWAELRPVEVTLGPGQVRSIQVGLRTPRDATPGGHYAQVLLTARPAGEVKGQEIGETQISVPVFAVLGKNLAVSGELAPLKVTLSDDRRFWVVSTAFHNTGQLHVTPSGEAIVERKALPQSTGGTEYVGEPIWVPVSRLTLPPVTTPVLPGGERSLGAVVEQPKEAGEYRIRVVVRYPGGTALTQESLMRVGPQVARPPASSPAPPPSAGGDTAPSSGR